MADNTIPVEVMSPSGTTYAVPQVTFDMRSMLQSPTTWVLLGIIGAYIAFVYLPQHRHH